MNRLAYAFGLLSVCLIACGGGGDPGPGPLKHHLDEQYIAAIPLEEKNAMLEAQNEYHRAKAAKMKAEADYNDAGTQLDIGKNEVKQAKLDRDSAQAKKKAAEESGDQNRINLAKRDERVASLQVTAAEKKVSALEARRTWLKKLLRYHEENTYAAEARYELAKANLAKAKNISPKGFAHQPFVEQQEDRSRRAQRAKLIADQERDKFMAKKKEWEAQKREADQARGIDTAATGN
ncbi:MAG TPA: hypothetical protein VKZ63_15945 [Kofleriaceae bacterium]|nr:hypothetical protein [Kofleriaceae bacterium]